MQLLEVFHVTQSCCFLWLTEHCSH